MYIGDCIDGSGEVPQDELGPPWFELDEADGELYDVFWPVLMLPLAESVLDLDPLEVLIAFPKKSYCGLLPTVSSIEGLKRPERLDISPLSICAGVWVKPELEPLLAGYCKDWLRGLTESLSLGLFDIKS